MTKLERYENILIEDLLIDEYFIHSILLDDDESKEFWLEVEALYPHQKELIYKAQQIFKHNIKLNRYIPDAKELEEDTEKLVAALVRANKQMRRKHYLKLTASIAASVAIICISVFYWGRQPNNELTAQRFDIERAKIVIDNEITLVMQDTTMTVADQFEVDQHSLNSHIEATKEKPVYNQLIVPYGRRSSLLLADGSKILVNSGTIVEFPTNFEENVRHIKVDGEIYIDVAKDEKKKFIVSTPSFDVEVVGTSFDVSAYTDDAANYVVLVEGQVMVKKDGNETIIKPHQQYLLNHTGESVNQVKLNDFVAWRHGWLQADNHTLEELSKQLSRYYNINISCNPDIAQRMAGGKLRLFDNVEEILQVLSTNMNIKYTLDDDRIQLSDTK